MDLEDYLLHKNIPDSELYAFTKYIFSLGKNVSSFISDNSINCNSQKLIEYVYELQAGQYIRADRKQGVVRQLYCKEIGKNISKYSGRPRRVLDCGSGELTTLLRLMNFFPESVEKIYATDISYSRLSVGRDYWRESSNNLPIIFCSNMGALPFKDNYFDLVLTCHSIEPNGSTAIGIVKELLRVSNKILAFEPSYKLNSNEGRMRMEKLGYINELADIASNADGIIEHIVPFPMAAIENPLNPTSCYVISKKINNNSDKYDATSFTYPGSSSPLITRDGALYSSEYDALFPILSGIPILKLDALVRCAANND